MDIHSRVHGLTFMDVCVAIGQFMLATIHYAAVFWCFNALETSVVLFWCTNTHMIPSWLTSLALKYSQTADGAAFIETSSSLLTVPDV